MKTAGNYLLDAGEIRTLEGLRLMPRNISGGRIRGDRLTRKKGVSVEFADFRDYVDGDDVRHLDWNVLARMQSPVIRTYRDEEDIAVYVILDCSPSMNFGEPKKIHCAKKLASAISFVALAGGDALNLLSASVTPAPSRTLRGRRNYIASDSWMVGQAITNERSLKEGLLSFTGGKHRNGLVYIVSDGLDPNIATCIAQLAGRGHEVAFIQVLAREEVDPDIEGDLRLVDSEDGTAVEITATSQAVHEYQVNLTSHCTALASACVRYGGRYANVSSDCNIESFSKDILRRQGWVA